MYSERLLDHFRSPRFVGTLAAPAVTVEVSNPACGDVLHVAARITEGVLVEVAYQVRGCTASIASGSAMTEWLNQKPVVALGRFNAALSESLVGGLAPESKHAAVLCVDAVRALSTALSARNIQKQH